MSGILISNKIIDCIDSVLNAEDEANDRDYSYFHPSEFADCLRKIAYNFYGAPKKGSHSPQLLRIFDNGSWMHLRYTSYFERAKVLRGYWKCLNPMCGKIFGREEKLGVFAPYLDDNFSCECGNTNRLGYEEVRVTSDPEFNFYGNVDAVIKLEDEHYVLDYKSMNSFSFKRFKEPYQKHIVQVNIYLWLLGLKKGFLLYENKDNQEVRLATVERNDKLISQIQTRAKELNALLKSKKLPQRKYDAKSASECKNCLYRDLCWKSRQKK